MKKLNQSGFAHWTTSVLPLLVIAGIAVIGVKVLTASHAATGVVNGSLYNWNGMLYSPSLVYQKQVLPGNGTTTDCLNADSHTIGASQDGTKIARVCINKANNRAENIVTYTATTGANFKVLAKVPTTTAQGQMRWQKAKLGTANIQIAAVEFDSATFKRQLALYDSVTGARKVVSVNGDSEFMSFDVQQYDWSADGKKINYEMYSNNSDPKAATTAVTLCTVDISLASPTNTCLAPINVPGASVWESKFSPDGTKVAIITLSDTAVADTATATTSLYIVNSDSTGLKLLAKTAGGTKFGSMVWAPTGTLIALNSQVQKANPYKNTVQIRSVSTGAVSKSLSDPNNNVSLSAWL